MKNIRYGFLVLLIATLLSSCNEDEDDNNPPTETTFPVTLSFSEIRDVEFRIWTDSSEINTTGLNAADFIDPEDWVDLDPQFHEQSDLMLSFDHDSVYVISNQNQTDTFSYNFRNDSLFFELELPVLGFQEFFFGIGDLSQLITKQGYYEYCINNESITNCETDFENMFFDQDYFSEKFETDDWVNSISEQDTLIVYNQRIIYN